MESICLNKTVSFHSPNLNIRHYSTKKIGYMREERALYELLMFRKEAVFFGERNSLVTLTFSDALIGLSSQEGHDALAARVH